MKQAIQELKESEARYRTLIEQALDGVMLIQDGLISYANHSLVKLVGYSRDELVGSPFEKYIPEDLKAKITDNYKKRMNNEPVPTIYEAAILHKSGARLETEFNAGLTQLERKTGRPGLPEGYPGKEAGRERAGPDL